jgi:hypothetical protein
MMHYWVVLLFLSSGQTDIWISEAAQLKRAGLQDHVTYLEHRHQVVQQKLDEALIAYQEQSELEFEVSGIKFSGDSYTFNPETHPELLDVQYVLYRYAFRMKAFPDSSEHTALETEELIKIGFSEAEARSFMNHLLSMTPYYDMLHAQQREYLIEGPFRYIYSDNEQRRNITDSQIEAYMRANLAAIEAAQRMTATQVLDPLSVENRAKLLDYLFNHLPLKNYQEHQFMLPPSDTVLAALKSEIQAMTWPKNSKSN